VQYIGFYEVLREFAPLFIQKWYDWAHIRNVVNLLLSWFFSHTISLYWIVRPDLTVGKKKFSLKIKISTIFKRYEKLVVSSSELSWSMSRSFKQLYFIVRDFEFLFESFHFYFGNSFLFWRRALRMKKTNSICNQSLEKVSVLQIILKFFEKIVDSRSENP